MNVSLPQISLLLDSGAFSAYNKKTTIDIDAYGKFAQENAQHLTRAINLDLIYPQDPEYSAEKSHENFLYLKDTYGVNTMPVFHYGESIKWLDKMLEETDYIGLSASMTSLRDGLAWYSNVWQYITDRNGYPIAKFHAFGDTATEVTNLYPWYSADSTTWIKAAGLAGRVFINNRSLQFRTKTDRLGNFISDEDTGQKRAEWEQGMVALGLDPDKCFSPEARESDIMMIRTYINVQHFLWIQEQTRRITRWRYASVLPNQGKKQLDGGTEAVNPMRLYFAVTSSIIYRAMAIFSVLKVQNMLISYFYVDKKLWDRTIIPYMYDPMGVCLATPKIVKQFKILNNYLLNPVAI